MTDKQVINKLKKWSKDYTRSELERDVISMLLDEDEDYIIDHMKDVLNHGCQSGVCGNLIYYKDTYEFFDKHYSDIQDMLDEFDEQGIPFDINKDGNIKNTGAWLAYEETVRKLLDELQIEY